MFNHCICDPQELAAGRYTEGCPAHDLKANPFAGMFGELFRTPNASYPNASTGYYDYNNAVAAEAKEEPKTEVSINLNVIDQDLLRIEVERALKNKRIADALQVIREELDNGEELFEEWHRAIVNSVTEQFDFTLTDTEGTPVDLFTKNDIEEFAGDAARQFLVEYLLD